MQPGVDYLVFEHTDALVRARLQARRKGIRSSIISLVFTLVFLGVLMLLQRDLIEEGSVRVFSAIFVGISLISIAVSVVLYLIARQDFQRVQPGPAIVIDREGLHAGGRRVDWAELKSFTTRDRRLRGPEYVITPYEGPPIVLGVEHLANFPATVDSAVRVYSGGVGSIDLSGIDH
ncbi:hypothetical protein [Enemella sp. A6]|uniref:hypothetical protein n=1 Tax=Enemella sp. A6 TaxID=3440152 RepID=UPI003EB94A30